MNDDVNDAAWILVHTAHDISKHERAGCIAPRAHSVKFSVDERIRLRDAAQLYCDVSKRYMEVADV